MRDPKGLIADKIKDEEFVEWLYERIDDFKFVVYQGMSAMNESIENLDISVRSYRCLAREGCDTINSVVNRIDSRQDLCEKFRNMGRKTANEVMLKLFLYTYDNLKPEKRKAYLEVVRMINQ